MISVLLDIGSEGLTARLLFYYIINADWVSPESHEDENEEVPDVYNRFCHILQSHLAWYGSHDDIPWGSTATTFQSVDQALGVHQHQRAPWWNNYDPRVSNCFYK